MKNMQKPHKLHKPEKLIAARKSKGLSQIALGKQCGLSRQAINKIENGGMPRLSHAMKIAKSLDTKIEEIFGYIEE